MTDLPPPQEPYTAPLPPLPNSGFGAASSIPVRRLYRSRHDRKVSGVSAGVAEYFAIDPTIVRLGMLAFLLSGVGIFAYIAAWIIVPVRPEGALLYRPAHSERTMTAAFGLAALALVFGVVTGSWQILAIALIGGGIWLLSEQPAGVFAPASGGLGQPDPHYGTGLQDGDYWPGGDYVTAPVKEHKPQRVTWVVLSLLALLTAVGIAAATGDWWNVSATHFLGVGVVIIGIGVVVGQVRNGGARGLIPLGILCALALFPVSAVDGLATTGVGASTFRPLVLAEVQDSYAHGIGELTVDLSAVDLAGFNDTIDISLGVGELVVIVPEALADELTFQADGSTGSLAVDEGININETFTVVFDNDEASLDLKINVGVGAFELRTGEDS